MGKSGYISEFMAGGRILSHGKITSLANGFHLKNNVPFTIYVKPTNGTSDIDTVLPVQLSEEDAITNAPVLFYEWSPLAISMIGATNATDNNDIYWGAGEEAEPEL